MEKTIVCSDLIVNLLSTIFACYEESHSTETPGFLRASYSFAQYAIEQCFFDSSLEEVLLKFAKDFNVELESSSAHVPFAF